MLELNLIYCELASLLVLHQQLLEPDNASATQRSKGVMSDTAFLLQLVRISDWVAKTLSGQVCN